MPISRTLVIGAPFRASSLELDYSFERRRYDTLTFQRDSVQDYGAELNLNFSSRDRLRLAERTSPPTK